MLCHVLRDLISRFRSGQKKKERIIDDWWGVSLPQADFASQILPELFGAVLSV